MEDTFLSKPKTSYNKCQKCPLKKVPVLYKYERENLLLKIEGRSDVLFVVDSPLNEHLLTILTKYLSNWGIANYAIIAAIQCCPKNSDYDNFFQIYQQCNVISQEIIHQYKPKVIVPIGKALHAVLGSTDIISWHEVSEFVFGQTYVYDPISNGEFMTRVYPLPEFDTWKSGLSMEFAFVLKQIEQIKKVATWRGKERRPKYEVVVVENSNEFLRENMGKHHYVAIDTETTGLNTFDTDFEILCINLAFDSKTGYVLPFDKIDPVLFSEYLSNIPHQIYAESRYDCKVFHRMGITGYRIDDDVITSHHLLNTEKTSNSIKVNGFFYGFGGWDKELENFKSKYKIKSYKDIPKKILYPYSGIDAIVTFFLWEKSQELFEKQPSVRDVYYNVIIPVSSVFLRMEIEGIDLDFDYLNTLNKNLEDKAEALSQRIQEIFGKRFNVNSFEELGKVIQEAGWECYGLTDKQIYSTSEENLLMWAKDGKEGAKEIIEYRKATKLRGAFVGEEYKEQSEEDSIKDFLTFESVERFRQKEKKEGLMKFIQPDRKIHPLYGVARTDSGRTKCSNPNIMQFPKQNEEGKLFRPSILCPPDYLWFEADYSGFQLRIACIMSGDEVMKDIFLNKSGDMHSITAREIFARDITLDEFLKKKKESPYKEYRQKAKTINFAFLFGASFMTLVPEIRQSWSEEEINDYLNKNRVEIMIDKSGKPNKIWSVASDIRTKFFKTYTALPVFFEKQFNHAMKYGYVDSVHGLRRHLPKLLFSNMPEFDGKLFSNLKNISINSPVQAFEAVEMYKAMNKIENATKKYKMKSRIKVMVHDAIGGLVHKDEAVDFWYILRDSMEDHTSFDIPITCEIDYGRVWGFGKEIKESDLPTVGSLFLA
jgi:DNA polymerase-1